MNSPFTTYQLSVPGNQNRIPSLPLSLQHLHPWSDNQKNIFPVLLWGLHPIKVPDTKWISINVDSCNSHFPKNSTKKSEWSALDVKPRWGLESVCLWVCTRMGACGGCVPLAGAGRSGLEDAGKDISILAASAASWPRETPPNSIRAQPLLPQGLLWLMFVSSCIRAAGWTLLLPCCPLAYPWRVNGRRWSSQSPTEAAKVGTSLPSPSFPLPWWALLSLHCVRGGATKALGSARERECGTRACTHTHTHTHTRTHSPSIRGQGDELRLWKPPYRGGAHVLGCVCLPECGRNAVGSSEWEERSSLSLPSLSRWNFRCSWVSCQQVFCEINGGSIYFKKLICSVFSPQRGCVQTLMKCLLLRAAGDSQSNKEKTAKKELNKPLLSVYCIPHSFMHTSFH